MILPHTKGLYIDIAKNAYNATNHKDEIPQMTLWLDLKEKMIKHQIKWRLTRSPPHYFTQGNVSQLPPRIIMTKHPSRKSVMFDEIKEDYDAKFIEEALSYYIIKFKNPHLSEQQIERKLANLSLPFLGLPVYHRIKLNLGHEEHHRIQSNKRGSIHLNPARFDKYENFIPRRFDVALINDRKA